MEKTNQPKYKKQQLPKNDNYNKSYYEVNKSKWIEYNEKQKQNYYNCEACKCSIKFSHKNIHFQTKKHIKNSDTTQLQTEIKTE
jgi:hypothetical protein